MQDDVTYLPYASGLIAAFSKSPDYTFRINEEITEEPYIVGISVSMWNLNAARALAFELHAQYPWVHFVFGGPSASLIGHIPFQHYEVLGEGEQIFNDILNHNWKSLYEPAPIVDLDSLPSPYLTGVFDRLMEPGKKHQAIVETNRGCPYSCAYCYWGKAQKRLSKHSLSYIEAEARWMGKNKIEYVFCADGNFGILPRDVDIARIYARAKRDYGYPKKFRVCYAKNSEDTVFEAARILSDCNLAKTVTLSRQSTHPPTLEAINRDNISQETFDNLQGRYSVAKIPTYTELILGLPEETYDSFANGITKSIKKFHTQLLIYPCEVLPNTTLADIDYQMKHGITPTRTMLTPVHATPLYPEEYEDIVTSTNTMPAADWRKAFVLSRMAQLFYSLKVLPFEFAIVPLWERMMETLTEETPILRGIVGYFYETADGLIDGKGRCGILPEFGDIYWEPEEIAFLNIAEFTKEFYDELRTLLPLAHGIIQRSEAAFPALDPEESRTEYARQVLLYGRKNNKLTKETTNA